MEFIAKAKGFIHDRIVNPGETFEEESGFKGGWAVPAKEYKPDPEKTPEEVQNDAVEGLQGSKKKKKTASKKKKVAKKAASKE